MTPSCVTLGEIVHAVDVQCERAHKYTQHISQSAMTEPHLSFLQRHQELPCIL